jgi:hypothetical protein
MPHKPELQSYTDKTDIPRVRWVFLWSELSRCELNAVVIAG